MAGWRGSWQHALLGKQGCSHGAGTLEGAGTGEEEGRMELPLGGQFQNSVWDEAVGKEDFTQPPL